ncbi:HK97 gp10 family phage protein [Brevibacillus choshinensis]|uniref:HK97 gp10 family phage protein n=1 Tax=Brevibacillus choshinensis TaxID=54911 RepID=UPI002E1B497C|nr:HK97 gp10 family phage protein [Brevibacillus choshinensis]
MDFLQFETKLKKLDKQLPEILQRIVLAIGEELLNQIVDEIQRQDLIDTGGLWQSFTQGGENNIWEFDFDRNTLTLEVGSNLPYAEHLNDGYTITKGHFVPGYWKSQGGFVYDPDAKTGFWARPRSFIGRKYFDIALQNTEGGMNALINKLLQKELERMVG